MYTQILTETSDDTMSKTSLSFEVRTVDHSGEQTDRETIGIDESITIRTDSKIIEISLSEINQGNFWSRRPTDPLELRAMIRSGLSKKQIADQLDVSPSTVGRWIDRAGLSVRGDPDRAEVFEAVDDTAVLVRGERENHLLDMDLAIAVAEAVEDYERD